MEIISQKFWNFILKNSEIYFSYSHNKAQNSTLRTLEFNSAKFKINARALELDYKKSKILLFWNIE